MTQVAIQKTLDEYVQYYESLTPETVGNIRQLAHPEIHFRDPFNDIRGIELVIQIMSDMFRDTEDPKFVITERLCNGSLALLKWDMSFRPKKLAGKEPWLITGISEIRFNDEGKIIAHLDYWDAATHFYERVPLLGAFIRVIKRKLQVET